MRKFIIAATIAAISIPGIVAADAISDAVKARQDHMKGYGKNMGALAKMAKGEVDYDAAGAQAAADAIAELAGKDQSGYWLPGSSSEDLPGVSRALPAIWADGSNIGEVAAKFGPAVGTLQAEAGKGKGEMAAALGGVGGVCAECHKSYQAEKQ